MRRPGRWQRFVNRHGNAVRVALALVCAAVLAVSLWQLLSYGTDAVRSQEISAQLQALYHEEEVAAESVSTADTITVTDISAKALASPVATSSEEYLTAEVSTSSAETLESATERPVWMSTYPSNPYRTKNTKITKLQRQNSDIIGWLEIGDVLDEAVVQKDNSYYLTRDYKGYHNVNGAIFLDEACDIQNQPLLYVIHGHNMKTEAMFGSLHKWDQTTWYHENSMLHLTTLYEEGDYVIFAAGEADVSLLGSYLSLYQTDDETRQVSLYAGLISYLLDTSSYDANVGATSEDQLVLLLTCTGEDTERRFIAARRLRDDETVETAKALAKNCWKK